MITINKPDGTIDIELTNGCPPGSNWQLGTTYVFVRINNGEWIRSPLRSSFKTKEAAESLDTVEDFVTYMKI